MQSFDIIIIWISIFLAWFFSLLSLIVSMKKFSTLFWIAQAKNDEKKTFTHTNARDQVQKTKCKSYTYSQWSHIHIRVNRHPYERTSTKTDSHFSELCAQHKYQQTKPCFSDVVEPWQYCLPNTETYVLNVQCVRCQSNRYVSCTVYNLYTRFNATTKITNILSCSSFNI